MQIHDTIMQQTTPPPFDIDDRRRTLRLRRSSLLELRMEGIDRPSIKIAETLDEYQQAFRLVHDAYASMGYIRPRTEFPYHYSTFSLLPDTCLFIFKSGLNVIATLTQIHDVPPHGLPMDKLYKKEVDKLRSSGRVVVELSSFVTLEKYRMRNIMVYLCKVMFDYSRMTKVNDICVMVNPKHVKFYTRMFLFSPFGPEKYYETVGAPAVALRVNLDDIDTRLREKYSRFEFTEDLHNFFCRTNTTRGNLSPEDICQKKCQTSKEVLEYFRNHLKELG